MTDLPRRTTYSLFFDVYVLGQRVREVLAASMATSPLRPEDYAIYSVVFEDEAVSPTAMAVQLSMPLTTIVDAIRTMEGRGHVRRIPNPRDGRSYLVVLTGEGLRVHSEAHDRFDVGYQAFVAELPDGEAVAQLELAKLLGAAQRAMRTLEPAEHARSLQPGPGRACGPIRTTAAVVGAPTSPCEPRAPARPTVFVVCPASTSLWSPGWSSDPWATADEPSLPSTDRDPWASVPSPPPSRIQQ